VWLKRSPPGTWDKIGVLIDRSQDGAERLLGNQVPETIALARLARDLGAVAASAFGAGFGGSVGQWSTMIARKTSHLSGLDDIVRGLDYRRPFSVLRDPRRSSMIEFSDRS